MPIPMDITEKSDPEFFLQRELDDEADAEAGDTAIDGVGRGRTQAGNNAGARSLVSVREMHRTFTGPTGPRWRGRQ